MINEQAMRKSSHFISSKTAYLIGVEEGRFWEDGKDGRVFYKEVFEEMEKQKPARIVRNLSILRTSLMRNWAKINSAFRQGSLLENLSDEFIPEGLFAALRADGINLTKEKSLQLYQIKINSLISDRINNCKGFYPDWIPWEYIRNLFVMPGGNDIEKVKEQAQIYHTNFLNYPHQIYINFKNDCGKMLYSDLVFLTNLYKENEAEFTEGWRVSQITEDTKKRLCDFLRSATKAVILVDCENTNPFNLYAALLDLEREMLSVVSKIILYNDVHTSSAWERIQDKLQIPVEHIMTQRVLDHKSLVDTFLTAGACTEHFKNGADSLIIASSDSDYWGLVSSLKEARFLLLVERERCSPLLRDMLQEEEILYCFLEDFPSETADELRELSIYKGLSDKLNNCKSLSFNLREVFDEVVIETRAQSCKSWEDQLYKKIKQNIRLEVSENGEMSVLFNGK